MRHAGGAAKVAQFDGALVTNQQVLNLRARDSGTAPGLNFRRLHVDNCVRVPQECHNEVNDCIGQKLRLLMYLCM